MSLRHAFMTVMPLSNWRHINKTSVSKLNRVNRANSSRVSYLQLNQTPQKDCKNCKHLEPVYRWKYQKNPAKAAFIYSMTQSAYNLWSSCSFLSLSWKDIQQHDDAAQQNCFLSQFSSYPLKKRNLKSFDCLHVEVNCILGISFSRELLNISNILWYRVLFRCAVLLP